MREKVIGIIGGMGPEATVDIFSKIVLATPSRKDQDHLRVIIDNNPKVPSRFKFIMGEGENPLPYLLEMAKNLEKYGADLLLISCNAAHHFFDQIQAKVRIPILHIAWEVLRYLQLMHPRLKKAGLMASGSTVKAEIYQKVFQRSKIQLILPESQEQEIISEMIYGFKQRMRTKELERKLMVVAHSLVKRGAQVIILGCTELPIILGGVKRSITFIDANEILARSAIKKAKKG